MERAFSLFRLYLGTSPSEKRGGGDEKKVTAAELRFLLTSLGDLSDSEVDAMVQQADNASQDVARREREAEEEAE